MRKKAGYCGKEFVRNGFDFVCGQRHSYGNYDICDECKNRNSKRIKKVGLCYSELVTLKKLWDSANFEQKMAISKNVTTISQFTKKVPNEARFPNLSRNGVFQSKKRTKSEGLHLKTPVP